MNNEDLSTNSNSNEISFIKHLFNWKYYAFLLGVGFLLLFSVMQTGYTTNKIGPILLIMAIIITSNYKANFWKKVLMFFASWILFGVLGISIVFGIESLGLTKSTNQDKNIIINKMIKRANKDLPVMMDNEFKMLKMRFRHKDTISMYMQYVNYSKDKILLEYNNDISKLKNELLQNELKTSCNDNNIKQILSKNITMELVYVDKSNIEIANIFLTDKLCQPYYKDK